MSERMFGVESEYALFGLSPEGQPVERTKLLGGLFRLARAQVPFLPCRHDGDLFLRNGSRFYVDCGEHPELGTPECTNPWDAVRYVLAGERLIAGLCDALAADDPLVREVIVLRSNVDYSGARSTWGCHESYLHRARPTALPEQIIPHLVTRVIYAGAGGFNTLSRGLEFTLSPRVPHLLKTVSGDSTANRGIFHTKDEPLCSKGYHRLHLLCGESLCSETASWLKIGTTALVVALIDAGLRPGEAVALKSPLDALRSIAADPGCRVEVELAAGGRMGALAIQRHYLARAEQHLGDDVLPPWAPEVCRQWRTILDRLEEDPASLSRTLDWAIKRQLYAEHARRRGIGWDSLPAWTHILGTLNDALARSEYRDKPVRVEFVLGPESPVPDALTALAPFLAAHSLRWADLRPFVELRQELYELDLRFGRLGAQGLFAVLDRSGTLAHHVPGVDNIEHAMAHPPAQGRARVRGEVIGRLAGRPKHRCDWDTIWDLPGRLVLDLSDPFESEERWREPEAWHEEATLSALFDEDP